MQEQSTNNWENFIGRFTGQNTPLTFGKVDVEISPSTRSTLITVAGIIAGAVIISAIIKRNQ